MNTMSVISKIVIVLVFMNIVIGCGGSDGSSEPGAKITILNYMSTSVRVIDGVNMARVEGSNSIGDVDIVFNFTPPIAPQNSATINIPKDKCDIYWSLYPMSGEIVMMKNPGRQIWVPCNKTVRCTARIQNVFGVAFGNLDDCAFD